MRKLRFNCPRFWLIISLTVITTVAEAAPIDLSRLKNTTPGAGPAGLYFHSSIPAAARLTIVSDLAWLHDFGPFQGSESFARQLRINKPVLTGADLVQWLLQRVRILASIKSCPFDTLVILDDSDASQGLRLAKSPLPVTCELPQQVRATTAGAVDNFTLRILMETHRVWHLADERDHQTDGVMLDDFILIHPLKAFPRDPPVVLLNLDKESSRFKRLVTLFHEARHLESGASHITCGATIFDLSPSLGGASNYVLKDRPAANMCDVRSTDAYGTGATLSYLLASNCRNCSSADKLAAFVDAQFEWNHVNIPLRQAVAVDQAGYEIPDGLMGQTLSSVPHLAYFVTLRAQMEARRNWCLANGGRTSACSWQLRAMQQVDGAIAYFGQWERDGKFSESWSRADVSGRAPNVDLGIDAAAVSSWIRTAERASSQGYNVPLTWMPPCAQFGAACNRLRR